MLHKCLEIKKGREMRGVMDNAFGIDVVIVLYNSDLKAVKSLDMLLAYPLVNSVVVCDNSDDGENHLVVKKNSDRVHAFNMGGNAGLSKAYNFAISKCSSDYVLILDDDTELPSDFFTLVAKHIEDDSADVYMPLVYSSEIMMSPCGKNGRRFVALSGPGDFPDKILSGINSGLVVRRSVYDKVAYREELFLDMVDHAFFDDVRACGFRFSIMSDVTLFQDYSRETNDFAAARSRYKISKHDNRVYFEHSLGDRVFCEAQLFYWKLRKAIKYKRLSALTW